MLDIVRARAIGVSRGYIPYDFEASDYIASQIVEKHALHPSFKGALADVLAGYAPLDDLEAKVDRSVLVTTEDALVDGWYEDIDTTEFKYVDTDPDPSPNPGATRLRIYWTRGKGAAKIRWNTPGDWTRCVRHLRKYVGPEGAKGLCAVYHRQGTGVWPGSRFNVGRKKK